MTPRATAKAPSRRSRSCAFARTSLAVIGTVLVFVAATGAGVVLHLDHPSARRLVSGIVNSALAEVLNGTITLDKVDRIALLSGRVAGMDVTIRDPEGHTVIVARWVSAEIALLPLLRSLIDDGPLLLRIERVRIDGVDVTLRDDASGVNSLANTFLPRASSLPVESNDQGTSFVLTVERISIGHVWAHGTLGSQPMDVELDELSARLRVDPDKFAATLWSLAVYARALPIPAGAATGSVQGNITVPFAESQRTAADANVRVRTGELSATARVSLDGEAIEARVDVPTSPASALSAVVEDLPLIAPVRARIDASGTLRGLFAKGRVDLGEGYVDLAGSANLSEGLDSALTARIVRISLSDSFAGMPPGIIDAEVEATARVTQEGVLLADYDVSTSATTIDGQKVPSVAARGRFDGERLTGKATIHEPGALTTADYVLAPEHENPSTLGLDVDVRTEIPNLALAPRLGTDVRGAVSTRVQGHLTLDDNLTLDAVATGRATRLSAGSIRVDSVLVKVRARGRAQSPTVHATAHATNLRAGGIAVTSATVNVDGEVLAPRVRVTARTLEGDTLVASANLSLGPSTTLRNVDARLVRHGEEARARVSSIRLNETGPALQNVSVQAAGGSLLGSMSSERGALRVSITSTAFDLGRIRTIVGPSLPALTGMATVHVDLEAAPDAAKGFVRISARDVGVGADVHGAQVNGEVVFDGRSVKLRAAGSVPDVGAVLITSDNARLGAGMLGISSYRTMSGVLNAMIVGDLEQIAALFPKRILPVDHIAGKAVVTMRARRLDEPVPEVSVGITTAGLELTTKTVDGVAGTSLRGIDLALSANYDPHTEWVTFDALARDVHGLLAELHAGAKPSPDSLSGTPDLREELLRTPFQLWATAPRRDLQHLPDTLRVPRLRGLAALELSASGTARDPNATVKLRASDVTVDERGPRNMPVDLRLDAVFEDGRGSSTAEVSSEGKALLVARAEGNLQVADLIDGRAEGPRWSAGGDLAFSALPLRALRLLAGQPIGGCVSGTVSLRGLHEDAKVDVDMHVDDLRVGRALISLAKVKARAGEGIASVDAHFEQGEGSLTAKATVGIVWGEALTPSLDSAGEATGRLRAKAFRLAPLRPFLRQALGRIDGILDADLRYRGSPSDPSRARFEGEASVRDGVVDVALLGQELREIQGKLTISPNGELRLRDASAEGIVGRVVVDATAHLDWLALRDAKATVRIARSEAMSITYEGVELGNAWGDVDITVAKEKDDLTTIDVVLPRFHLELPQETARSSQKLDDEPTIRIGTYTEDGFTSLLREPPPKATEKATTEPPLEGTSKPAPTAGGVLVRIDLGKEVRVYRTNAIDAWLSGKVHARVGGSELAVSGAVQVDRGFVELYGRRFKVENAMASFDPTRPPEDPTITATAVYDAPDDTRVFADYTGTVETGKLRLYSDPALEQTEILSLIAFGTRERAESSRGSGSAGAAGTAASAGGGIATQGLNKVLSDVTPVEITTRVDTSDAQDPRPEVAVAITDKVSVSVGYRVGLPMPGQNPDRSTLRVEYRFRPRWLLETSVGDKGTSIVDLFWRLRY